jgi:hypothetical protein
MSGTPDSPGLPGNELDDDDDAAFDDLGRRAGAALRRPAPEHGASGIARQVRRGHAIKTSIVAGTALAMVVGALYVFSAGNDALAPVDTEPALRSTTTAAPSTTALTPVVAVPETPAPTTVMTTTVTVVPMSEPFTIPAATTPDALLPVTLSSSGFPRTDLSRPVDPARQAVVDLAVEASGLHGQGHQILADWNSDGFVTAQRAAEEGLVGCAESAMTASSDLVERADDAITSMIANGIPLAEISAGEVVAKMTEDDPAVFDFDLVQHKYFLLRCGGIPDEQATAIAEL